MIPSAGDRRLPLMAAAEKSLQGTTHGSYRWLLMREAADEARVSERTMRRWVACGFVRQSKPAGGRALIDATSLHAFLEAGANR